MKPKTELLLYHLLWHADLLMRPSFRNLNDSYEGWAYRRGFLRQIRRLEAQGLLEQKPDTADAIYRLSDTGRITALGGRDPEQAWNRTWDGVWRTLVFDVPVTQDSARKRLRRRLKQSGFGYLQNSVWISPDPVPQDLEMLGREIAGVEFLTCFDCLTRNPDTDIRIVRASWPFEAIHEQYERCRKVLMDFPGPGFGTASQRQALLNWARAEQAAWKSVVEVDPFLPAALQPTGYRGREVWRLRGEVLRQAGEAIHGLNCAA